VLSGGKLATSYAVQCALAGLGICLWLVPLPGKSAPALQAAEAPPNGQRLYADVRPYIEEPPKQLAKRVPQLKGLVLAESQQQLPVILHNTGERVDEFFSQVIDLMAREEINLTRLRQELPSSRPELSGERVRDSYLILRHGSKTQAEIIEYRTDPKGDNFDQTVVNKGYVVTSGFALECNYFGTGFQNESMYRYLGDQKLGAQDTYVVGFAQIPGKATLSVRMRGRGATPARMLVQGVAWIDKSNFQIVRMHTDLLVPRWDIGVNQQITEVTLGKVQLADIAAPLWLPSRVKVYVEFTTHNGDMDEYFELSYTNEHRYSDYQRYRVKTKVMP